MELFCLALGYLVAVFIYKRKQPKHLQLENNGERLVRLKLKEYCLAEGAHLLNNITLKLDDGTTTQIDHIVISQKGILVIETKDYSGWIFGKANDTHWTQTHYKLKRRFQNPLRQNYRHLKAVQEMLDFMPEEAVQGLIVFTSRSKFKTHRPDHVVYESELRGYLSAFKTEQISLNRVQFCVGRLEFKRMEISKETDIEHVQNLKQRFGLAKNITQT